MERLHPRDEADLRDIVAAAASRREPLEIMGHGTRRGLGRPVEAAAAIDLSGLAGMIFYEPAELVLRAKAATPLALIEELVDEQHQEFAFEPMRPSLWGSDGGTLGGMIAVNASGPRRLKAGAARDHLLGFRAVTGRGDAFKSGGRVMKNVTGYDLPKLIAGSHGTLAVMSEITVRVLPKAENEETLLVRCADEESALRLLRTASGLPDDVSCFACLPDGAWMGFSADCLAALRLEGPDVSIAQRRASLLARFEAAGRTEVLERAASRRFWAACRDVMPLCDGGRQIWRVSTAPTAAAALVATLKRTVPLTRWLYDWAGGLVWLALEPAADAHVGPIRAAVRTAGGHATLFRAEAAVRTAIDVFHPQPPALAALSRRVKESFDPLHLLNRHRLGAAA